MIPGAPPCPAIRGGEAVGTAGTASAEAERHQSSATGPGVSIHPPSRAPRGEEVSFSASSSPAQSVGVSVAEKPSKARRWGHNAIKRRKVQRDRGRPDTSPPMTLASVQLYPCPPLRARLTEQGCAQNRARPLEIAHWTNAAGARASRRWRNNPADALPAGGVPWYSVRGGPMMLFVRCNRGHCRLPKQATPLAPLSAHAGGGAFLFGWSS